MATTFVAVTNIAKAQEMWDLDIVEYIPQSPNRYHKERYTASTCQSWWRPVDNPSSVLEGFYGYYVEE